MLFVTLICIDSASLLFILHHYHISYIFQHSTQPSDQSWRLWFASSFFQQYICPECLSSQCTQDSPIWSCSQPNILCHVYATRSSIPRYNEQHIFTSESANVVANVVEKTCHFRASNDISWWHVTTRQQGHVADILQYVFLSRPVSDILWQLCHVIGDIIL